jgi:hypothetical protein
MYMHMGSPPDSGDLNREEAMVFTILTEYVGAETFK